jgi:hypothetical protein
MSFRATTNHARGPQNPFSTETQSGGQTHIETTQEAVVVDVIVNDSHKGYSKDGYNIGAVKFRFLKNNHYRDTADLNWALPMDTNITSYPLLDEIIVVTQALNRFYYTKKINVTSRVTAHPLQGLNDELSPSPSTGANKAANYQNSTINPIKDTKKSKKPILGEYFEDKEEILRLRHDEGDTIFEGRTGQTIRMGAAWKANTNFKSLLKDQSPNMLFRVGPNPKAKPTVKGPHGLVVEDINKDASSIWMVTDQIVPLEYATAKSKIHGASVEDFPNRLTGNQIIINTDRFVLNTKKDKIMGHSLMGIHWTTNKDFTIDADRDLRSKVTRNAQMKIGGYWESVAGKRHSFASPKVYLGSIQDEKEPLVCGAQMAKFLNDFLNVFIKNAPAIIAATGTPFSPSPLSPAVVVGLGKLKADVAKGKYASFNSRVGYTVKTFKKESPSVISNPHIDTTAQSLVEEQKSVLKESQTVQSSLSVANSLVAKQVKDIAKEQISANVQLALISAANVAFLTPIQSKLTTAAAFKLILEQKAKVTKAFNQINDMKRAMQESIAEVQAQVADAQAGLNAAIAQAEAEASHTVEGLENSAASELNNLTNQIKNGVNNVG